MGCQDTLECFSEFGVEYGVDDRVEGRVRVAQPRQDLEGYVWDARLTEGCHDVDAEEGHLDNTQTALKLRCSMEEH